MLTLQDENYVDYEVYYLMNFMQLPLSEQLNLFYVKDIIPVKSEAHHGYVDLDHDFNPNIVNPLYQLFISCFLNSIKIMPLLEILHGVGDIYHEMNSQREELFDERLSETFFADMEFNTSLDGFNNGVVWQALRVRSRVFLKRCGLLEDIKFSKPLKFTEFLYPEDFLEYEASPRWSLCGQFMSLDDWMYFQKMTMDSYRGIELTKSFSR